jgi:hypothetical protein
MKLQDIKNIAKDDIIIIICLALILILGIYF